MKKIIVGVLIILSFFVLVSCKGKKPDPIYQDYNEIKKELVEQKESFEKQIKEINKKVAELENQDLPEVIALKQELDNLEKMLEKFDDIGEIANEIERLDTQLELVLVELEKLQKENNELKENYKEVFKMLVYLNLNFIDLNQNYGLSKTMSYDFSSLTSLNIVEIDYKLINQFTKLNSSYDPVVVHDQTNLSKSDIPLDVSYHGIYNMEFTIKYIFSDETLTELFTFNLSYATNVYNLTWLHASMPVLLFTSDLFTDKVEGIAYVEIERAKTYDFDELPSNAIKYPKAISASKGDYDQTQIQNFRENVTHGQANLMIKWMEELYEINNNSKFVIYGVDNILNVINSTILSNVPYENLSFKIYTDGSFTSGMINVNYKNVNDFISISEEANKRVTDLTNGKVNNLEPKHILALTNTKKFEYIVNSVDSWIIKDELTNALSYLNVRAITVSEAFEATEIKGNLDNLEYLLRTKWGEGVEESMSFYFNTHDKMNLLILGTSTSGESHATFASFNKYIEYISNEFEGEYKLFYKGHPQYPSNSERQKLFAQKDIYELANSIPVETLMLLYPNVYIGGYAGTSFQSSLVDQTVFFFGTKAKVSTNAILANLINNDIIFDNSVYLTVDSKGNVILEP